MDKIVSIREISKNYGRVTALRDLSFDVREGELFGLIGPDGAGKTTLFRILTTLILADKGKATVDGLDVVADYKQIRAQVGYMPGRFSLYPDLTVEENLAFFATLFHTTVQENYELVKDIYQQIEPFKKRRAGKLSGGMKQKLALSCALIHKPRVLFLDEPTTGVDPVSRKEFWGMLRRLKEQGITIIVSTPYMDEASLCERIALLREGSLLEIESPETIIGRFRQTLISVRGEGMFRLLQELRKNPRVQTAYSFGDVHHVTFSDDRYTSEDLKAFLAEKGHTDVQIHTIRPGIEDCYMALSSPDHPKNDSL